MTNKIKQLIISIIYVQLAGLIGSIFTTPSISTWYQTLTKPSYNPPNWVFAPVWTLLFLLMGISLFLIWTSQTDKKTKQKAISIFNTQLLFNILWSLFFFTFKNPTLAFVEIIFLWILIFINIKSFSAINRIAGILLIPYILWVSFAAFLNLSIVLLN